jgi:hypothetical protein
MGKKSKKKASSNNNNKRSATNKASVFPNVSSGAAGAGHHDQGTTTDDNKARDQNPEQTTGSGIYATYKKCTEAVKEWAMLSLKGQDKSNQKPRHKRETTKQLPLSTVLANLHALAATDTVMPSAIFRDLKVAIRLRRQASAYYYYFHRQQDGSSASSCRDGHRWIIGQLVLVYRAFCDAARRCRQRQTNDTEKNAGEVEAFEEDDDGIAHVENRFAALAGQYGDDESSLEDEDEATATFVHNNPAPQIDPPSETMVQEEERHFAIACALLEVEKLRQDIRKCWQDWATASTPTTATATTCPSTQQETSPATVTARALLEACCVSRYAILMAKSSIISTCVEFDAFHEFDEILHKTQAPSATGNKNNSVRVKKDKFEMGQHVIITGLVAKPAFNHQCGTICSIVSDVCDRYGVQIGNDGKVIAVKPENLLLSDYLLVGLHQVYEAMSSLISLVLYRPWRVRSILRSKKCRRRVCRYSANQSRWRMQYAAGTEGLCSTS